MEIDHNKHNQPAQINKNKNDQRIVIELCKMAYLQRTNKTPVLYDQPQYHNWSIGARLVDQYEEGKKECKQTNWQTIIDILLKKWSVKSVVYILQSRLPIGQLNKP